MSSLPRAGTDRSAPRQEVPASRIRSTRDVPFLARFAGRRSAAPTPRGETTFTEAVETTDEH